MFKFVSFLPEVFYFFSLTIIFVFAILIELSSDLKYPSIYVNTIYLCIISLTYTFLLFLNNNIDYFDFSIIYKSQSNILISELLIFICIIIFLVTFSYNSFWKINSFEYLIFLLISLGSFFIFLSLMNIIFMYIILELQSILISILISVKKYNRYSIEASIKYFILGSFSSLVWLYGFSIIYGSTGLLSLHEMNLFFNFFENISNNLVLISTKVSSVLILIGVLFKIYSAPFHFWLPDIYEGSPTSVLIYISTIQLFIMVLFFLKIYYYLLINVIQLKLLIYIISIITLLFGSIGTLLQRKLKKLISFSAITMNGFFLYSIVNNNYFLVETSLMYLIVYIFTIMLLLSFILNIFINNTYVITHISDLFKMYNSNNCISIWFTILFFSISGIPPFIGFISKLFWLKTLIMEYSSFVFFLLLTFLIVSFYYFRLINNIYTSMNKKDNFLYSISVLNYESAVIIIFIQVIMFIFILNTKTITNFIKIVLIDYLLI